MRTQNSVSRVLLALGVAIFSLPLTPVPAPAQTLPLAQFLPDLVLSEIVLQPGLVPPAHVAHFSPIETGDLKNPVVAIVQGFNTQMATQFSTFPLGSSSGGMTYVFDDAVG